MLKKIVCTVTNDLTYDQRMQRICSTLAGNGYAVKLVGRQLKNSLPLKQQPFEQKRIRCLFNQGFLFYAEYNFRLFWYLLFQQADLACAIDLDTILPCYLVSALRSKKRVYDAHELFTEQKEIVTRPFIHKIWLAVERFAVPKFKNGYTVNHFIAGELQRRYVVQYSVVRNLPVYYPLPAVTKKEEPFIIYQGAVNEGRSFETLIPAMQYVNARLVICGKGNFFTQVQQLIAQHGLNDKIELKGYLLPETLQQLTPKASIAITLFESTGLNQYYSLSNRFFDYMMAAVPQVCVNYPEYKAINDDCPVAYLITDTNVETIAAAINKLLNDTVLYEQLQANCVRVRETLNWTTEASVLLLLYKKLLG